MTSSKKLIAKPMLHIFFPELSHFESHRVVRYAQGKRYGKVDLKKTLQMDGELTCGSKLKVQCLDIILRKFSWVVKNTHRLKIIAKMLEN